jgi:hypothetical protein
MILNVENPRFHQKLLESINKFSKFSGLKNQQQKILAFYTQQLTEKEIKEISPMIASKNEILRHKFNKGDERCMH